MKCEYENAVHKIIELAKVIDNRKNAMWVNGKLDKKVKGRLLTIGKILNQNDNTNDKNCNLRNVNARTLSFASCALLAKSMPLDQAIQIIKSDITGLPQTTVIDGELVVQYVR